MVEFALVFIISYIWHAMGVTIGYHRLLSHRSFSCSKFVEYFWVLPGYLAFEGSPIWWSTIHRAHHRHVETVLDPHSPRALGIKYAFNGWLMEKKYASHLQPDVQCKDLVSDPIYRFLEFGGNLPMGHAVGFAACFGFRLVLWALFGWQVALASLLAGFAVLQIPLLLNVVCHLPKAGYKRYALEDDSVNVWWVGLLAMGEGWHNNHHASPGSAKTGMKFYEIDMSWWMIALMKKLHLIQRVTVADHDVLMARSAAFLEQQSFKGETPVGASILSGSGVREFRAEKRYETSGSRRKHRERSKRVI